MTGGVDNEDPLVDCRWPPNQLPKSRRNRVVGVFCIERTHVKARQVGEELVDRRMCFDINPQPNVDCGIPTQRPDSLQRRVGPFPSQMFNQELMQGRASRPGTGTGLKLARRILAKH